MLRRKVLSLATALGFVFSSVAVAQDATTPPPAAPPPAAPETAVVGEAPAAAPAAKADEERTEEIVVTGTRIRRKDLTTPAPVTVINRDQIVASGKVTIADFLQSLPEQGNAINTSVNNGGDGATRVSLRGAGTARTLVLVNGRRFVPGGTGADDAVDLNSIPTAAIERIEVLKDGASAVYGSDAIAGVVNLITRKGFNARELSLMAGTSQEGDGQVYDVNATVGTSGDTGSIMFSAGYYRQEKTMAGDRDWANIPKGYYAPDGSEFTLGSGTIPSGRIVLGSGIQTDAEGNVVADTLPVGARGVSDPSASALYNDLIETCPTANEAYTISATGAATGGRLLCPSSYIWDPNSGTTNPAYAGLGWRNFRGTGLDFEGGDGYNFQPENYLVTPSERIQLFAIGDTNFGDVARGYFEASYVNRRSGQDLAAEPLLTDLEGVVVSADNAYNPFGRDIGAVRRRLLEFGRRTGRQDIDTFRVVAGVDGSTPDAFGPLAGWFWDVSLNYGRTTGVDQKTGNLYLPALQDALGETFLRTDGTYGCGPDAANEVAGCVPLDLFHGPGSITPDQVAGLTFTGTARGLTELTAIQANTSGELFAIPTANRPVGLAFGVEYRDTKGEYIFDPITEKGLTTGNKGTNTEGGYDVYEAYGELSLPIVSGLPFAEDVEATLAARVFDYSTFGNDWTYKLGARWRIIPDVTVRGTFSTAFRAPSVSELYQGASDNFASVSDPCAAPATPEIAANCNAAHPGSAGNGDDQTQLRSTIGGNPNLDAETADIFTAGIVFEPRWVKNLSMTLDYYDIDLTDAISFYGESVILNGCYTGASPDPTYCALIERDTTGRISNITNLNVNVGGIKLSGIDLALRYALASTVGRFGFTFDGIWTRTAEQTLASGEILKWKGTFDNGTGSIGGVYPEWKFNAGVNWGLKNFGAGISMRYIGSFDECSDSFDEMTGGGLCSTSSAGAYSREVEAWTAFDLFASYALKTGLGTTNLAVGVLNALDAEPAVIYNGFLAQSDPTAYDFMGRFFYVRLAQSL
jgi:outer membrane receptor protein involved in Fe transport